MNKDDWMQIAARLTPRHPEDLSDLTGADAPGEAGGWVAPHRPAGARAPAASLWRASGADGAFLGVRVSKPVPAPVQVALKLIAIAAEKSVRPIIFSHLAHSGFEPFGFRVERLGAADAQEIAARERELMAFWDIAILVDVETLADLR